MTFPAFANARVFYLGALIGSLFLELEFDFAIVKSEVRVGLTSFPLFYKLLTFFILIWRVFVNSMYKLYQPFWGVAPYLNDLSSCNLQLAIMPSAVFTYAFMEQVPLTFGEDPMSSQPYYPIRKRHEFVPSNGAMRT